MSRIDLKLMDHITNEILDNGYAVADSFFSAQEISNLEHELFTLNAFNFQDSTINCTNLLHNSSVAMIAAAPLIRIRLQALSVHELFPVRAIVLDKTEGENWQLPWHQDLKIKVQQRIDMPGYTNWSLEAGVWHVHPPLSVLEELITIRIHLDPCTEKNGAIHVIPGSHKLGILPGEQIPEVVSNAEQKTLSMQANSIMLMRPLLLHDSPPSFSAAKRRVLQLEYGFELNNGLRWL